MSNPAMRSTFPRYPVTLFVLTVFFLIVRISLAEGGWAVGVRAGRTSPGDLVLISTEGEELLLDNAACFSAAFSPDVSEIAYVRNDDIYVTGVDGNNRRQIHSGGMINNGTGAQTLSWCTNGFIYYSRDWDIYRIPANGEGAPEKVHTSRFSDKGDRIRQLQVCRDGSRACSWGRPRRSDGINDGHVILYTIGTPAQDRRWDNHCMGAISKSGKYFNACHASHATTSIIEFDKAPPEYSKDGRCPGDLGGPVYRNLSRRSNNFDMHRFSQVDEDFIMWIESNRGYVVRVSSGETVLGGVDNFTPQDYVHGELSFSSAPVVRIESPFEGMKVPPGTTVPIRARVTAGTAAVTTVSISVDGQEIAARHDAPWEASWTAADEGHHFITVTATDGEGASAGDSVEISVVRMYAYPDSTPHAVPGRIECEHFNYGGQGVAYHDESEGNTKTAYRSDEDVDVDNGATGRMLSSTRSGEWLHYTVSIPVEQAYDITVSAANGTAAGNFHIEIDGEDVTGPLSGSTGSYDTWQDFSIEGVVLPAGEHVLTLRFDETGHTVDYIDILTPENPITLIQPAGGDTLSIGEELVVEWTSDVAVVNDVHVEFSSDGGRNWVDLSAAKLGTSIDETDPEWERFLYTITPDMLTDHARVRIREYGGSRAAESPKFSITASPSIQSRIPLKTGKNPMVIRRVGNSLVAEGARRVTVYSVGGKRLAHRASGEGCGIRIDNLCGVLVVHADGRDGMVMQKLLAFP